MNTFYSAQSVINEKITHPISNKSTLFYNTERKPIVPGTLTGTISIYPHPDTFETQSLDNSTDIATFKTAESGAIKVTSIGIPPFSITGNVDLEGNITLQWFGTEDVPPHSLTISYEYEMTSEVEPKKWTIATVDWSSLNEDLFGFEGLLNKLIELTLVAEKKGAVGSCTLRMPWSIATMFINNEKFTPDTYFESRRFGETLQKLGYFDYTWEIVAARKLEYNEIHLHFSGTGDANTKLIIANF